MARRDATSTRQNVTSSVVDRATARDVQARRGVKLTGRDRVLAALVLAQLSVVRAYEIITSKTVKATGQRGEVRVHCPSRDHADEHPSCDLKPEKKCWKCITCGAGGGILDLAVVAGQAKDRATAAQWFASKLGIDIPTHQQRGAGEQPARKRIAATYSYHNPNGIELYQVVRYEPKDFRQRRRNGGRFVWNLNGVLRVPYRLPELHRGIEQKQPIIVVEGEKDVDALRQLGFVATTNAGGAQWLWTPEFVAHFRSAIVVVVVADNDTSGREAALSRANALFDVVPVRVIERLPAAPEKGDVSDLISAGWNRDQFAAVFESAPFFDRGTPARTEMAKSVEAIGATAQPSSNPRRSQADLLVELVDDLGVELVHDSMEAPYAIMQQGEVRRVHAIRSLAFRTLLAKEFFERHGKAPRAAALGDARSVLEGRALHAGRLVNVSLRVAGNDDD